MEYILEQRTCQSEKCDYKFKCLPTSKQKFCSRDCQIDSEKDPKEKTRLKEQMMATKKL